MKVSLKACLPLVAGVLSAFSMTAVQAEEVTLRAISSFAPGTAFARPFEAFVKKVNEEGKGIVQINYLGGPETMPPCEVGNAVSNGVVDMANVTSAFYTTLMPWADGLKLATVGMEEQRSNGAWEYINELHNEQMNTWYLARTGEGVPFHLYTTRKIDEPNLKGMTLRVTPVYNAFFRALGGNVVQTAPGEVYTALERGVVQGYGWPVQGILDLGWQDVTDYRVDPGFYNVDVNILVNLDRWKSLTDEQRDFLTEMALWTENFDRTTNIEINEEERQKQADAGIETITFDDATAKEYLRIATESGWKQVEEHAGAEEVKKLRSLITN